MSGAIGRWYDRLGADEMRVVLVALTDCPYLAGTRIRVQEAFDALSLACGWREATMDEAESEGLPRCPSPTVFVDGDPVGGLDLEGARHFRGVALRRVVPFGTLVQALERARKRSAL